MPRLYNSIWRCNAINGLPRVPDNFIHLTVTSPPYDGTFTYGGITWDQPTWSTIIHELYRATIRGGIVAWMARNAYLPAGQGQTGTVERQVLAFIDAGFRHDFTIFAEVANARRTVGRYY